MAARSAHARRLGLGSGLVVDSKPRDEWAECLLKGVFVERATPAFDLIETMRFDPHDGIVELERHLDRLQRVGRRARLPLRPPRRAQRAAGGDLRAQGAGDGAAAAVADRDDGDRGQALSTSPTRCRCSVAVRPLPVEPGDFRLRHKTTDRRFYDRARQEDGAYETIFVDPEGRLTEGSRTNIFVERDGRLLTPPLSRGLIPGILRAQADRRGRGAEEADLTPDDLAGGFFVGNIVRGLIPAQARLGGDREAQQPVGDRDQRRGAGADLPDDFGMVRRRARRSARRTRAG